MMGNGVQKQKESNNHEYRTECESNRHYEKVIKTKIDASFNMYQAQAYREREAYNAATDRGLQAYNSQTQRGMLAIQSGREPPQHFYEGRVRFDASRAITGKANFEED